MLRGLTTVSFFADDLAAAGEWYTELLGVGPYFRRPGPDGRPGYIEFRIGDYQHELGIIDTAFLPHAPAAGPAGAVIYWHVDDVRAAFARLRSMGAEEHQGPIERGEGFTTASVIDPFGNILGVMQNPHYLEILGSNRSA
jgi:predicted enzyme related to lactoylglutathione lyase